MNYVENGQAKNALVKVNLCHDCAIKLNYKKLKDMARKKKKKEKKHKKDRKKSNKREKAASVDDE
jgi:protein FRA10AC1